MAAPAAPRYRLLVVDTHRAAFDAIESIATPLGFDVEPWESAAESLDTLLRRSPHLAILDLSGAEADGLTRLRRFRRTLPGCPVVVTTSTGCLDEAVEAMKQGARDYLTQPLDAVRLAAILGVVRGELVRRSQGVVEASERPAAQQFAGMLGRSAVMLALFDTIRRLAPHTRVVLISGETGTGKDLVARAFHQGGPRAGRPLVRVYASAFDDRALQDAAGATLCLDEIGDLDVPGQARLLRALEDDEARRRQRPMEGGQDLAVIATTRHHLRAAVSAGRFRDDLFYRLSAVEVGIPPLRERREDIAPIAQAALKEMATRLPRGLVGMTQGAERLLTAAPWPGNVRELRSVVERACLAASGPMVTDADVESALKVPAIGMAAGAALPGAASGSAEERARIVAVLAQVRGNRQAAAKLLGISRRALYRRLERYQIGAEAPPRRAYLPRAR